MEPCVDIIKYGVGYVAHIKQPSSARDKMRRPLDKLECTIDELRALGEEIKVRLEEFDKTVGGNGRVSVRINAREHVFPYGHKISYADIVEMCGYGPDKVLSVIWSERGTNNAGTLDQSRDPITVRPGLRIEAADTSSA